MRLALLAALLVFASRGVAEEAQHVYVYAKAGSDARSWLTAAWDGEPVAEFKQGTFFAIRAEPGRHSIAVEGGIPAFVEIQPGLDVYLRLGWPRQQGSAPIPAFHEVRPEHARKEMVNLRYVDSKRIFSDQVAKADPRGRPKLRMRAPSRASEARP